MWPDAGESGCVGGERAPDGKPWEERAGTAAAACAGQPASQPASQAWQRRAFLPRTTAEGGFVHCIEPLLRAGADVNAADAER